MLRSARLINRGKRCRTQQKPVTRSPKRSCATTARYLGSGIASLLTILNPNTVVVPAGVTAAGETLFGPLRAEVVAALSTGGREARVSGPPSCWHGRVGGRSRPSRPAAWPQCDVCVGQRVPGSGFRVPRSGSFSLAASASRRDELRTGTGTANQDVQPPAEARRRHWYVRWDVIQGEIARWQLSGVGGIPTQLGAFDARSDDWEIVPIMKVGSDLAPRATQFVQTLRHIAPDAALGRGFPTRNNRVELRYHSESGVRKC